MKLLTLLTLLFLLSCTKQDLPTPEMAKAETQEWLVKFKPGQSQKSKRKVKTKAMERFNDAGFDVIDVTELDKSKVEWAVPNAIFKTSDYTWHQEKVGVPAAWASGNMGSQKAITGIIDEGVMYWHPDLCGGGWVNPFDPIDGVDNDGNGYIDDQRGWDFVNNDNTIFDQLDNHGTHVAGIVNSVAKFGTYISGKFLQQGSGTLENAIRAIDYFTDLKIRHNLPIVSTNNSWGNNDGVFYQPLYDAIKRAEQADILFVAAAGNSSKDSDITPQYPGAFKLSNIINVASSDFDDDLSYFSVYGAASVHLAAPGNSIRSTVFVQNSPYWGYAYYSGTSMAAPHVTGAVLLYKSLHPSASGQEIKNAILSTARKVTQFSGKSVTGGILDVSSFTGSVNSDYTAKECDPTTVDITKPTAPGNLRVQSTSSNSITVTWDVPYDLNGVKILRLQVNADDGSYGMGYNFWGWYSSWNVPNLVTGKLYRFRMISEDPYANQSDSSNILWASTGSVTQPPPDSRSITLSGTALGKIHTLKWVVNGPIPESIQVKTNTIIATLSGTATSYTTTTTKKAGNVSYSVIAVYPDKYITSNSISLKVGR